VKLGEDISKLEGNRGERRGKGWQNGDDNTEDELIAFMLRFLE
jgi:hypothetical protein